MALDPFEDELDLIEEISLISEATSQNQSKQLVSNASTGYEEGETVRKNCVIC